MIGGAVQQRVDPGGGHMLVAHQLGPAAFQACQFDIRLENVLLGGLAHLVFARGNLAELRDKLAGRCVDFHFPPSEIIVVERGSRRFRKPQPGIADVAFHRVGLGRGGGPAERPLAGPRDSLRGLHHPAAAVIHPGAARADHPAEHRVVERNDLRVALGGRPPRRRGCLDRRIAGLDFGDEQVQGQFRLAEQWIGRIAG